MRTPKEQTEGLLKVIEAAGKLHQVNLTIYNPQGVMHPNAQLALTGMDHGRDTEIVYIVGGYDVWLADPEDTFGEHMAASDLALDEAAHVIADAYMFDKASKVLARQGLPTGAIEEFLEDDIRREEFYVLLDRGSDQSRNES